MESYGRKTLRVRMIATKIHCLGSSFPYCFLRKDVMAFAGPVKDRDKGSRRISCSSVWPYTTVEIEIAVEWSR